jgi:hypothetical protein
VPGNSRIPRLSCHTPPAPSATRYGGHPIRNESAQTPFPHCPGRAERGALAESGRARRSGAWAERAHGRSGPRARRAAVRERSAWWPGGVRSGAVRPARRRVLSAPRTSRRRGRCTSSGRGAI